MMRGLERTGASRFWRSHFVAQILRADDSGAGGSFRGRDADFKRAGQPVPLHSPGGRGPVRLRCGERRVKAAGERAARPIFRQKKADRRATDRFAGFIGDLDGQAASGSGACRIDLAVTFCDANVQQLGGIETRGREEADREEREAGMQEAVPGNHVLLRAGTDGILSWEILMEIVVRNAGRQSLIGCGDLE